MTYEPTIHTQADLLDAWRHVMEPLGFDGASIWMMLIDPARRAVPHLLEIAEADEVPGADETGLAELLETLDEAQPGYAFAFLRTRPGRGVGADDRDWASYLYESGRRAGVPVEVVHLATDHDVVPLPLDEVGLPRTA